MNNIITPDEARKLRDEYIVQAYGNEIDKIVTFVLLAIKKSAAAGESYYYFNSSGTNRKIVEGAMNRLSNEGFCVISAGDNNNIKW